MGTKQTIDEHKKNIQRAAYNWAMEDLHQKGAYDSFFDMLIGETDDRWIIPSYLAVKLSEESFKEDGMFNLAYFLSRAIEFDVLYEDYVSESRKVLEEFCPGDKKIERLFEIYDKIRVLSKKERTDDVIAEIIGDTEYADCFC